MTKNVKNTILLYADYTTLYATHTDTNTHLVQAAMQEDINNIVQYATQWPIKFNKKTTTADN